MTPMRYEDIELPDLGLGALDLFGIDVNAGLEPLLDGGNEQQQQEQQEVQMQQQQVQMQIQEQQPMEMETVDQVWIAI